ncbi:unnamed protein product [Macrosiphum euphorbiae]|uniref:Uncharacterized protein n=1 Tax=Macrosiphum euphorbiae TaxID=13131 RepID=A0AAV0XJR8_9HEMI|nr:unnamed protein product [Macrosiphum euphorbiae]
MVNGHVASGFWRKLDVPGPSASRSDGWHKIRQCRQQLRLSTLENTDENSSKSAAAAGDNLIQYCGHRSKFEF